MSNAGSTRGHGDSHRGISHLIFPVDRHETVIDQLIGRELRRSSNSQTFSDATLSVFQSQRNPTVSSSRRRRGYQPDEVNKKTDKLESKGSVSSQGAGKASSPNMVENHPKASPTNDRPASTVTQMKDKTYSHQPSALHQLATTAASRRAVSRGRDESDLGHLDGTSERVESEASSFQIITERKPSCWSIASPPEASPTEWNSVAANIDRPAKPTLPIYRFPKAKHKAERELASNSFHRQQARLKSQAHGSTPEAQKARETNGSTHLAIPEKDEAQAPAHVTPEKDGHAAESLLQQLGHHERLDASEASQVKAIQDEVLSRTVRASHNVQLESKDSRTSLTTQYAPQTVLRDVSETTTASSALPSQPKINQVPISPKKQNGTALPHLRVLSSGPGTDSKSKPLPPHLAKSPSPSPITATKAITYNVDLERGKHIIPSTQAKKLPPHLQGLSTTKAPATEDPPSVNAPLPTSKKRECSYRPTIDMDEEIAATQPILDIDDEIIAGLRAEEINATAAAQPADSNAQETNEQVFYVPPHIAASSPRSKPSAAESNTKTNDKVAKSQADQHQVRNHSTNTRSNGFSTRPRAGTPLDSTSKRKNATLASTSKNGAVPDDAGSSVKKGKRPAGESGSVDLTSELIGWDGKMNQPPVGDLWDSRRPFNSRGEERLSVIEAWREEHAADPEEKNRVVVNTASASFQTGEGLAGGDANVFSPIDKMDDETRASNDEFTQARRHRNAAEAIKEYEAKIAAKPKIIPSGIEGMTKEEKRSLRRALIEEERTRRTLPNPHAPAANVYLRPAEFKDMGQVTKINNYYIRTTSFVLDLEPVDELYWYVSFPIPTRLRPTLGV